MDDPKLVLKAFGKRVRELRVERGMSQEELAHLSGLDRSYLGGVERGERNISLVNITKLEVSLGIKIMGEW